MHILVFYKTIFTILQNIDFLKPVTHLETITFFHKIHLCNFYKILSFSYSIILSFKEDSGTSTTFMDLTANILARLIGCLAFFFILMWFLTNTQFQMIAVMGLAAIVFFWLGLWDTDELERNTSETIQLQDLPTNILTRIFMHLNYRERIRLELVSPTWRAMALNYAWKDQRIMRFTREMLHLKEPWTDKKQIDSIIEELNRQQSEVTTKLVKDKSNDSSSTKIEKRGYERKLKRAQLTAMKDYRRLLTNPALYKREKTAKQLAPLKAILHRCAPFIDELHLLGPFDIQLRFGRIFSQLDLGRLAHLHIHVPLDSWHLQQIQCHLAPQLLSLAVVPIASRNNKALVAFRELLANCNQLENLQLAYIHFGRLFAGHSENNGGSSQPSSSSSVAQIESNCSFMPSTLKCLLIKDKAKAKDYQNPDHLVNTLLSLLAKCPQLCYMPITINTDLDLFKLIGERNPRELDIIISLQFPFFIAHFDYSFQYIQRSEFCNLKALQMDTLVEEAEILQLAKCCPNLEHLSIALSYEAELNMNMGNYVVDISNLMALHQFKRLSSLEIIMAFENSHDIHKMRCPGGERADNTFLKILTELNQINPLRSLDFKFAVFFSQDYLIQMLTQLKHLETFSCWYLKIGIDDMTGIRHFCAQLEEIFNSQEGANKKSLKFTLMVNPNKWDNHPRERERKNVLVEWQKGSGTKSRKMNWHCICAPFYRYKHFQPERSIVLHELFTSQFGQRTSSMLFDSFGTVEDNSQ